jgi:hypothetical protein
MRDLEVLLEGKNLDLAVERKKIINEYEREKISLLG